MGARVDARKCGLRPWLQVVSGDECRRSIRSLSGRAERQTRSPGQGPDRALHRPRLSVLCGQGRKVARRKRRSPHDTAARTDADSAPCRHRRARLAADTATPRCSSIGGSSRSRDAACAVRLRRARTSLRIRATAVSARRSAQAPWVRLCSGSSARTRVGFPGFGQETRNAALPPALAALRCRGMQIAGPRGSAPRRARTAHAALRRREPP